MTSVGWGKHIAVDEAAGSPRPADPAQCRVRAAGVVTNTGGELEPTSRWGGGPRATREEGRWCRRGSQAKRG